LKSEEESAKRWYNYWPFLVAVFIGTLNIDAVLIPSLNLRWLSILGFKIVDLSNIIPELSLLQIFICVIAVSIPGNIFWYWFWGWLGKFIFELIKKQKDIKEGIELVEEGIELGKEVEPEIQPVLNKRGFVDWAKEYLTEKIKWATDQDNKYLKRLKRGGYAVLFLMSASPEPGGRVVATIFSRSFDSKKGLLSLILGDTVKNFYMVFGFWNLVLKLPSLYFQIAVIIVVACFFTNFIWKKIKKT
jgi:hypothetical protein